MLKYFTILVFMGLIVDVTAYSPSVSQCDSTPFITASNTRVREGIIALSRDIEKRLGLKFGDRVRLHGLGVFEFRDRMHWKWQNMADIFMWSREKAIQFGRKYNITIEVHR